MHREYTLLLLPLLTEHEQPRTTSLTGDRVEASSKMTGQLEWRPDRRTAIDSRLPRYATSLRLNDVPNVVGSPDRHPADVQSFTYRRVAEAENL